MAREYSIIDYQEHAERVKMNLEYSHQYSEFFFTKINLDPDTVKEITLACCILHNVLCTLSRDSYTPLNSVDYVDDDGNIIEGEWRNEGQSPFLDKINNFSGRKKAYDDEDVRNKFKNFFQTVGIVPWQYQHVNTS